MRVALLLYCSAALPVLAQQGEGPLLKQLDPPRRAIVLMAILGLVLLGITLIALVMIGGRWVRRMARSDFKPSRAPDAAKRRQLRREHEKQLPNAATGETIYTDRGTDETVSD